MAVVSNGTTLIDNGTLDAAIPTGKMILLSTQTASASATISFTSGIDSTYDSYVFKFYNMHPSSDVANFQFNMSTDSGSNYNVTKTSTFFRAIHNESDSAALLSYQAAFDLAQGTGFQDLSEQIGFDNDQASSGTLQLFNPSSTVFVKHFIGDFNCSSETDFSMRDLSAGYGNTTSAVDAIQFKMSSGNIDSGVIKLYGIGG
jgi:hypothetical protein